MNSFAVITLIVAGWGPVTALFVANQYALARIITRAKSKKLSEIQAMIERLEAQEEVPSRETLEHISKLMDYHDRVRAAKSSALDLRAALTLANSLLLPLLSFILTNLDKVIEFFHEMMFGDRETLSLHTTGAWLPNKSLEPTWPAHS